MLVSFMSIAFVGVKLYIFKGFCSSRKLDFGCFWVVFQGLLLQIKSDLEKKEKKRGRWKYKILNISRTKRVF